MPKSHIYFFAGESSGDLHGSHLLQALRSLLPNCQMSGVGGPMMRSQSFSSHVFMEEFEVMGLTDVLVKLPSLWRNFRKIRDHILRENPKGVVLIDYPGFNLRLADALRTNGYQGKIAQYISPSVWAWGPERVERMAKTLDLLLTIYPFEKKWYADSSLPVTFVGNPLLETIQSHTYGDLGIPESDRLVALFPGSRGGEIRRNLPEMLRACAILKEQDPRAIFAVSCAHADTHSQILHSIGSTGLKLHKDVFLIPKSHRYELMRACRVALAKSGTVTLELALHGKPTVAVYSLSWMNRLYAQYYLQVNLPHYCIVNILSQKETFPELIEEGFSADRMVSHLMALMNETPQRELCLTECQRIRQMLTAGDASRNAAHAISELMQ